VGRGDRRVVYVPVPTPPALHGDTKHVDTASSPLPLPPTHHHFLRGAGAPSGRLRWGWLGQVGRVRACSDPAPYGVKTPLGGWNWAQSR